MTIHSDWAKALKMHYPAAFSATPPPPQKLSCGIIDGHIQIMGAYNPASWEDFLHMQFVRPIARLYDLGAPIVVLLFDNRLAVPPYKGMTQHKRCTRYTDIAFAHTDTLPLRIPAQWSEHMMNPHFKDKVISLVCERIQSLVKPSPKRALIVDFKGAPKMYTSPTACPVNVPGIAELGESDIKYARYVHMLGNSIVCATDGDYIAIAMLYYAAHGMTPQNNIYLFRQLANIDPPHPIHSLVPLPARPRGAPADPKHHTALKKARPRRGRVMVCPLLRTCWALSVPYPRCRSCRNTSACSQSPQASSPSYAKTSRPRSRRPMSRSLPSSR